MRDLADWTARLIQQFTTGVFNALGAVVTFSEYLAVAKAGPFSRSSVKRRERKGWASTRSARLSSRRSLSALGLFMKALVAWMISIHDYCAQNKDLTNLRYLEEVFRRHIGLL